MLTANKYILNSEKMLESYQKMLLLRRFEEKCGQLYGMGKIGGFCHLYIGQEAVVTGIDMAKTKGDSMITSYRDHGHIILAGTEPKLVLAELMGKATGCSKGKGGSMHLFDKANKFYGGHGIVGAQVPLGTGIAFAEKYKYSLSNNKQMNVCLTFLGDGAINQGQVYEAMNIASLWKLPVIYIIENNQYSMGTSVARSTSVIDLYKKGLSFGIEGCQVNGMDINAVYSATKEALEMVRNNMQPFIIEAKTYRYRGHSMSDPATYRTKYEVEQYKNEDPILSLKNQIIDNNYFSIEKLQVIEKKIKQLVNDAVEFANSSALPDPKELYTNVYHDNTL